VKVLLSRRADPNLATKKGVTPLHRAASQADAALAAALLGARANVDAVDGTGASPAHAAAAAGSVEVR
jgi:ankyrin repeat protein